MEGQESLFAPDTPYTKTSPEPCPPTKGRTGGASSKRSAASKTHLPMCLDLRAASGHQAEPSWATGIFSHGRLLTLNSGEFRKDDGGLLWLPTTTDTPQPTFFLTLNIGERPRTPNPTKLSQILVRNPDPKYNLSAKACQGILNRAARRGKELPPQLKAALEAQASAFKNEPDAPEGEKESSSKTNEQEPSQPSTSKACSVIPIEGNGTRASHRGNGYGSPDDPSFTLNSTEYHAVATAVAQETYGFCSYDSNAMKSANPNSGIYKADTSRTLDMNGGNPACNQGGVAVLEGSDANEPTVYNGENITSPYNKVNPQPGDPCHTLGTDTRNYVVSATETGCLNPWDVQSKHIQPEGGIAEALYSGECRYGGGESYVLSETAYGFEPGAAVRLNPESRFSEEQSPTLRAEMGDNQAAVVAAGFSFGQSAKARSLGYQDEMSPTLRGGEGGNQKPCVLDATATSEDIVTMNPRPQSMVCQRDMAATLGADDYKEPQMVFDARDNGDGAIAPTMTGDHQNRVTDYTALCVDSDPKLMTMQAIGEYRETGSASALKQRDYKDATDLVVGTFQNTGQGWWNETEVDATVRTPCGGDSTKANLVAAVDCRNATENPEVNGTLQAKEQGQNLNSNNVVRVGAQASVVRRLTPTECARLQGFFDDWVEIGEWTDSKGKVHKQADSPKYKAYGNSIAVGAANNQTGFWVWLARRICAQYERRITLGSFFDGISGFPLSFIIAGAKPVLSSEIEEFPMAVAKKHFGDEDAGIEGDVWQYLANQ